MSDAPLRLIVMARDQSARIQDAWEKLERFLGLQEGVELVATSVTEELDLQGLDADLVVVLGGDGAILRACRQMGGLQLPVLGVNLGRLGFLADFSPEEFREKIGALKSREYDVVEHLMFECELQEQDGSRTTFHGLNELMVSAGASLQMLSVRLEIDEEPVATYSCDGLIISTPVGSTAHSLSAGGPILRQDLSAFVVTPICPHTLTNRPIVDHADRVYTLSVPDAPQGTMLVIDGQMRRPIEPGDTLTVRKAPYTFKLIRIAGHSYFQTLHRKLGWAGQPRYRAE